MTSHCYHKLLLLHLYTEPLPPFDKRKNTVKFKILADYCGPKPQFMAVPRRLALGNYSLSHLTLFSIQPGDSILVTSVLDSSYSGLRLLDR
jgi:hypothetical protein